MIVNADNLGVSTFKEYAGITSFLESQKKDNPESHFTPKRRASATAPSPHGDNLSN